MPVDLSAAGGAAAVESALSGAGADAAKAFAYLASSDLPATLQRCLADLKSSPVAAVDTALALVAALARAGPAMEAITIPLLSAVLDRLPVSAPPPPCRRSGQPHGAPPACAAALLPLRCASRDACSGGRVEAGLRCCR